MKPAFIAGIAVLALVVVLLVYNLVIGIGQFSEEGVNMTMARMLKKSRMACVLIGVLLGHLFWSQ